MQHLHLHTRPVPGAEVKFPMRLTRHLAALVAAGTAAIKGGADGATSRAWFTLENEKQSRAEMVRALDLLKLHDERWDRMELGAEILLLGSFPSYSASSTKSFNLTGTLPPGYEVRYIDVVVEVTINPNATTSTAVAADYHVIGAALLNRIRASGYNVTDWHSLSAVESASLSAYSQGRFLPGEFYRIGTLITSGVPLISKFKYRIAFTNRNLEVPEMFTPSSDQLNLPGNKLDIDTLGSALTSLAIGGNAAVTVAVTDVKAYAVGNVVPVLHVGPPHYQRSRQVAQSIDAEFGAGLDQFLAAEETLATSISRVSQWNIARDGREAPRNVDPWTLSQLYGEEIRPVDGVLPWDFTQPFGIAPSGVAGVLTGSPGTQPGAQLIPLVWAGGTIREASAQWPFYLSSRQIRQNVLSGQVPSFTLLYWQTKPIYENAGQVVALARANGLDVTSVDQLVVRGGYDGNSNKLFKGRLIALPSK